MTKREGKNMQRMNFFQKFQPNIIAATDFPYAVNMLKY